MKRDMQTVGLCVIILAITVVVTTIAIYPASALPDKSELLIRFQPGVTEAEKQELLSAYGISIQGELPEIGILFVSAPGDALSALTGNQAIEFVQENHQYYPAGIPKNLPNDPYYASQWHLDKIGAPKAWDITTGDSSVIIAILDTGVDTDHPDLVSQLVLPGYALYCGCTNATDVEDQHGHGTAVAGVAAAAMNNGIGVASVAGDCKILPIRVAGTEGWTCTVYLAHGLIYAADHGAKVASISYDIYNDCIIEYAAQYFMDRGGLVFVAANNKCTSTSAPDSPYLVSVTGTTETDEAASTYGPYIDLAAPYVGIFTTARGGGYESVSGTSFAAPQAAGVAALMFSIGKRSEPAEIEEILELTADDLGDPGYDIHYGWGRINAARAVRATKTSLAAVKLHPSPPPHPTPRLK